MGRDRENRIVTGKTKLTVAVIFLTTAYHSITADPTLAASSGAAQVYIFVCGEGYVESVPLGILLAQRPLQIIRERWLN